MSQGERTEQQGAFAAGLEAQHGAARPAAGPQPHAARPAAGPQPHAARPAAGPQPHAARPAAGLQLRILGATYFVRDNRPRDDPRSELDAPSRRELDQSDCEQARCIVATCCIDLATARGVGEQPGEAAAEPPNCQVVLNVRGKDGVAVVRAGENFCPSLAVRSAVAAKLATYGSDVVWKLVMFKTKTAEAALADFNGFVCVDYSRIGVVACSMMLLTIDHYLSQTWEYHYAMQSVGAARDLISYAAEIAARIHSRCIGRLIGDIVEWRPAPGGGPSAL